MHFSADPDARWVKKGSKSTLGYKAFARTDEEGFVDKVHTTPANQAESPQFGTMIDGANAQRVLADKAYASKANRASLRGKHRDGIMRKAARNRPLRASEKRFNKLISKRRFRVEQCFGTMKRLFGLHRARYFVERFLQCRYFCSKSVWHLLAARFYLYGWMCVRLHTPDSWFLLAVWQTRANLSASRRRTPCT